MPAYVIRQEILASAARDANGVSSWFSDCIKEAVQVKVYAEVTAKSGTNPTLDIDIETTPDSGAAAVPFTEDSFTQFTDVGKQVKNIEYPGKSLRVSYTIGGTDTPTFTFRIVIVVKGRTGR